MKKAHWAMAALAGVALVGQAHSATMPITFSGGGVSGSLVITFGTATDAKYSNAFEITGVSGTFGTRPPTPVLLMRRSPCFRSAPLPSAPDPTNLRICAERF